MTVQWTPGNNRVFMTLWDGGGEDTYNLSNYLTAVEIDLRPGEWTFTSSTQRANLGDGNFARGNIANALLYNDDPRSLIENAIGGSSGDRITANQAANHLTGGPGADLFIFSALSDSAVGAADTITDFISNGSEKIDLEGIDAIASTGTNEFFQFIGTNAFSGNAGELRIQLQGDGVHILGDVNGDTVADLEIIVSNQTSLVVQDFFL